VDAIPLLLTVAAAVRVSGISRSELYRRLGSGELKGKKVGDKTRIRREDLVALVNKLPDYGD
jgi:excisionase family DNA binding protein